MDLEKLNLFMETLSLMFGTVLHSVKQNLIKICSILQGFIFYKQDVLELAHLDKIH